MIMLASSRTVEQRIMTVLLRTAVTLPIDVIAERAQCSDQAVRVTLRKRKDDWGNRLILEMGVKRGAPLAKYRMVKKRGDKLNVVMKKGLSPPDLWRGWVNPFTGIVPDKLGL